MPRRGVNVAARTEPGPPFFPLGAQVVTRIRHTQPIWRARLRPGRALAFLLYLMLLASPVLAQPTVEIFVTSWCPYCRMLESFLKENKIRYTRYDIEKDAKGAKLYKQLGHRGIPVTKVGSTVIPGYNPEAVMEALQRESSGKHSAST